MPWNVIVASECGDMTEVLVCSFDFEDVVSASLSLFGVETNLSLVYGICALYPPVIPTLHIKSSIFLAISSCS